MNINQKTENANLTYEFISLPHRDRRLKELIIYISHKCGRNPKFGATVLNKILWASDFFSYKKRGKSITGEKYKKLEHGPVPHRIIPISNEMTKNGDIESITSNYYGKTQRRTMPLREADLSIFNGEDIAIVDDMINQLCDMDGATISNWSHKRAWQTRNENDFLPYESCFLSDDPITESDIIRTQELVKKMGWECINVTNG